MKKQGVWKENEDWLQKNLPLVAVKMKNLGNEDIQVETVGNSQCWNLHVSSEEKFSFYLHSQYDRLREYQKISQGIGLEHRTLVLFGCVDMECLHYISKEHSNITHLILVEPHIAVFHAFLQRWLLTEAVGVFPKVSLIIGESEEDVKNWIYRALSTGTLEHKTAVFTGTINYQWNFSSYAATVRNAIVSSIRFSRVNQTTLNSFRELWLLNTWHNLSYGDADMSDFVEEFSGKPVIIVSAGPSLDKNIDLLQEAKNKALIVAVGSAMTILEAKGIKPHFRLAIDPGLRNEQLFATVSKKDVPLLYAEHLFYKVLPVYKAPKIQINVTGNSNLTHYLYKCARIPLNTIASGFSVANVAANLMLFWQCEPIVFVGQDLAYTDDRLHAGGSWDSDIENEFIKKKYRRKDIYGQDVYTDAAFDGERQILEWTINAYPHVQFFNASEGGVAIEGAPNCRLYELLQEWPDLAKEYSAVIAEKLALLKNDGVQETIKEELRKAAIGFKEEIEAYLEEIKQSKKIASRILKKEQAVSEKEAKQILRRIHSMEKNAMDIMIMLVFEETFRLRREGYLRQQSETKSLVPQVSLFFLEICEKEEYVQNLLKVIQWYINKEEFKVIIQ